VTVTLALRPAHASDAEPICLIYDQGIEDRVATLETELRTPAERREGMAARGPRHPVQPSGDLSRAGHARQRWVDTLIMEKLL
jgi:L-amino acid N-acyltransferase YncA